MQASVIHILGDSQLVIQQLSEEYQCNNPYLLLYNEPANELLHQFVDVTITHISKDENEEANDLAQ